MSVNIYQNPQFSDTPLGLKLRQTITASGSVTIPAGVSRVYAVCIGGGGGGGSSATHAGGGGAGGFSAGWTFAANTCTVGTGGAGGVTAFGANGGNTIYGMIFAGGGSGGRGTTSPTVAPIFGGGSQ